MGLTTAVRNGIWTDATSSGTWGGAIPVASALIPAGITVLLPTVTSAVVLSAMPITSGTGRIGVCGNNAKIRARGVTTSFCSVGYGEATVNTHILPKGNFNG